MPWTFAISRCYPTKCQQNIIPWMLGMGKKKDKLDGKVLVLDAKVSEVSSNQNSHNQTIMDIKATIS